MPELSWRDGEAGRTVILREGTLERSPELLAENGFERYELLSTERALGGAPEALSEQAANVHVVPGGPVPEAAAAIIDDVAGGNLVALGGGRVIDVAKAIAAVRGGEVAAIPTTLSGAEMTAIHRLPAGHEGTPGVRPTLVLADPELMTSATERQLRATAMNALAHGAESLFTPLADELSRSAALRGAAMIAHSLDADAERDRSELATGALLGGYAVDRAGLALHHVLSQTMVRVCATPHAETNATLLPHTAAELARREPDQGGALADALAAGGDGLEARIRGLGGGERHLRELGVEREQLAGVVETAIARPELGAMTPGETTGADLQRILEAAW
jgi:alcohol dehydrogenase class IV